MHRLSDPALEAILKEWHPQEYNPPNTDVQEWSRIIETLCDTYGIPDAQRAQCAAKFIKSELRADLESVLKDARTQFGPVHWTQFVNFMAAFDRKSFSATNHFRTFCDRNPTGNFREAWERLSFLLPTIWSALMDTSPPNRTAILQKAPETHWSSHRYRRWHNVSPSRYNRRSHCRRIYLCGCRRW
jgi:hypothetical protein